MNEIPKPPPTESRRALLTGIGGLAAGALIAARPAKAGPLDPPAGPVSPTPGPEPRTPVNAINTPGDATTLFKITQPGSYYLTSNLTGVSGKHGIVVAANGVTLDLNGFELLGVAGSLDGVTGLSGLIRPVHVRNGSVRSWGGNGVYFSGYEHHIRDVQARANGAAGISCGAAAIVESCTAANNGADGIACLADSVVRRCAAFFNTGNGISAAAGGMIAECAASGNSLNGIAATQCTLTACTATGNTQSGISGGYASTVSACSSSGNTQHGIDCLSSSTIVDSCAYGNTVHGIRVKFGAMIQRCTSSHNQSYGVYVFDDGGSLTEGGLVADCVVRSNTTRGIVVKSGVTVRGNQCARNSEGNAAGSGIYVFGDSCRVIDNHCNLNGTGIHVTGSGNLIQRNFCRDNAVNWDVAGPNACLVIRASTGIPTYGNAGGGGLGSTDPSVNFTLT